MSLPRVIPVLLLMDRGLVKTVQFRDPKYVGDPLNVTRIFNDKLVDELILLDIAATVDGGGPNLALIEQVAGECSMPLVYGGGIRTLEDIRTLIKIGVERVALNAAAAEQPDLVYRAAEMFGSQSIIVSVDVRQRAGMRERVTHRATRVVGGELLDFVRDMEARGAGEILLGSVDREGTREGYDLELTREVADALRIPVIAHGGASNIEDLARVVRDGRAAAAAAGSMFVFHGSRDGVLVTYRKPAIFEMDGC